MHSDPTVLGKHSRFDDEEDPGIDNEVNASEQESLSVDQNRKRRKQNKNKGTSSPISGIWLTFC